jgi:methylenetetrahydrofolate dehydrogenase (NADP+)/methenyltetrahydrofolate cyclohydrolase
MGFSNVYGVPGFTSAEQGEARILDGAGVAAVIREEVAAEVRTLLEAGYPAPALATILVGEDPASAAYVAAKHRACAETGIDSIDHRLPVDCSPRALADLIERCNRDATVSGILLQLPLPAGLRRDAMIDLIDPAKDVDGLSGANVGALWRSRAALAPCTPRGVIELLTRSGIEIAGSRATIVGRSELVGRPLAAMLIAADATVTVCHTRTPNLPAACVEADLLVAAVGSPGAIGRRHVKLGATVIDVGISRTADGLRGDVDFEAVRTRAGAITPVPGGVGPMTISCLLQNTVSAHRRAQEGIAAA